MPKLVMVAASRWMLLAFIAAFSLSSQAAVEDEIFDIVEGVAVGEERHLLPEPVRARELIHLFYQNRNYRIAWDDIEEIQQVLAWLARSTEHGLDPEDYHYSALMEIARQWESRRRGRDVLRARFDVLFSDGVLLYARHLLQGKVDPRRFEPAWNYTMRDMDPERISGELTAAVDGDKALEVLQGLEPDTRFYRLMKVELQRYRDLEEKHAFREVPVDTVLRPGQSHPNIPALRTQLKRLGFFQGNADDPELFDEDLKLAVQAFQHMHSLDDDGIVGRDTFRELNTSYSERADQIRINLDRVRWVQDDFPANIVIVNIAGFEMYYFRDSELFWETNVMVGTIKHQTPFFRSDMKYLVLNPDWTVPRSIIRRSLFPKFQADPAYVQEHNYKLFDADGIEADPMTMDWSSYSRNRFPYRVVQQPGPDNALGRVKFMFPNRHAIYLHDTPSRALFSKTSRAFSAGCIRVKNPLHFADMLLEDQPKWSREKIDQTIEGKKMQVVHLSEPLEVMLMYWTTSPTTDGQIQLHPDIYQRDAKVLAALREEPRWDDS
jgi:murein L,D-transpeptidase YcbB/YkuD